MKSIFTSRTFWIAVVQGVVGVLVVVQTHFPEFGWVAIAKSLIDIYLRGTTADPVKTI